MFLLCEEEVSWARPTWPEFLTVRLLKCDKPRSGCAAGRKSSSESEASWIRLSITAREAGYLPARTGAPAHPSSLPSAVASSPSPLGQATPGQQLPWLFSAPPCLWPGGIWWWGGQGCNSGDQNIRRKEAGYLLHRPAPCPLGRRPQARESLPSLGGRSPLSRGWSSGSGN